MPAQFNSVAAARLAGHGGTASFRVNEAGPPGYHPADQRSSNANPHAGENTGDVVPAWRKAVVMRMPPSNADITHRATPAIINESNPSTVPKP